ncbi:MAG: cobalamin-dependent protein, partial [Planctomycetota bacterium]|nr:cobalamin-dependent protein [Planctomycetota bacterium]
MQPRLALVFCYARPNRHSFNALAGALETDAFADDASVIFAAEEGSLLGAVAEALSAGSRTVVCVSFTTPQMPAMASLVRRLRRECASRVTLLAGGPHPTADPAGTLKLGVDIVVRGEGEATFLELLKRIGAGGD